MQFNAAQYNNSIEHNKTTEEDEKPGEIGMEEVDKEQVAKK